jgi:hypothetical protein
MYLLMPGYNTGVIMVNSHEIATGKYKKKILSTQIGTILLEYSYILLVG